MAIEATVTSKGQITIPKEVRKSLGLKRGKKVVFISEGRRVIIMAKTKYPLKKLEELRKELPTISESELRQMIKESKKAWRNKLE